MKNNPISDIVRKKRRSSGLTQAELASKAGVGLRFIRDLEQGKSSLRTDTVNKVLFLFGKCLGAMDLPKEEPKSSLARVMEFLDKKIEQARTIKAGINPSNMRAQFNPFKEWKENVAGAIDIAFATTGQIPERSKFYNYHPLKGLEMYVETMGGDPNGGLANVIDIHTKLLEDLKKSKKSAHLKSEFNPDDLAEYE